MCRFMYVFIAGAFVAGLAVGCGNSDGETEADKVGVGAECTVDPTQDGQAGRLTRQAFSRNL